MHLPCRIIGLFLVLALCCGAQEAQPEKAKLLTRYFLVIPSVIGWEQEETKWPLILDGLEGDETTKATEARGFLEARGIKFPPGASAIFYRQPNFLGVVNTSENIQKIADLLRVIGGDTSIASIRMEFRIVEYPPGAEEKLAAGRTFPALQKAMGKGFNTICVVSDITKSGNRFTSDTRSKPSGTKRATAKPLDTKDWPPSPGMDRTSLEAEPNLSADSNSIEFQFALRHSSSARRGQPALLLEYSTNGALPIGAIQPLKLFTATDEEGIVRHYAVLARCDVLNRKKGKLAD